MGRESVSLEHAGGPSSRPAALAMPTPTPLSTDQLRDLVLLYLAAFMLIPREGKGQLAEPSAA